MLSRSKRRVFAATRSTASMEFAMVAPIMITLTLSAVDGARLLLIWNQIHSAAAAVAESAEKLSITTNPTTGAITTQLTADQMQQAMSTIYAEIPALNLGKAGGLLSGGYAVILSSVTYSPLCAAAVNCGTQTASLLWSSALTSGGTNLFPNVFRNCGTQTQVARMPDTNANFYDMPSPVLAGGSAMTLAPQIVADVAYTFTPLFPLFFKATQLDATATLPAPIGGLSQTITLNTSAATGNVKTCS